MARQHADRLQALRCGEQHQALWICGRKPLDMSVHGAAVVDRTAADKAHEIPHAARGHDALAELAILDLTPLDGADGYDVQIAKRDLGKILDRIETVNKPKAA
jgi:hypothetical protein